jgi:ABC-type phosphate/phosphonate transport system substrate-binding protein
MRQFQFGFASMAGFAMAFIAVPVRAADPAKSPDKVKIGLVSTLFKEMPEQTVMAMMKPFGAIMYTQTGVNGELMPAGDAGNLANLISRNELQLGVFHGIEFAWVRQKHPDLQPLCIAVSSQPYLHAHLVVLADSHANNVSDVQNKTLTIPNHSRNHVHLFLRRRCQVSCNRAPETHFSKISGAPTAEEALDDVVEKLAEAAVVDGASLESYERRKPGRFAKLKIVETSERFPSAVIAYRQGMLDEATLAKFRAGMLNSNNTTLGKQLLALWKITSFAPVPVDYEKVLLDIVKVYPEQAVPK